MLEVNKTVRPDVVIHAAGTKDIKFCENNKKKAYQINANLVENITKTFQDSLIIYISTDYVFDGKAYKPYCEEFRTNPNSVYGKTKLDGELQMQSINPYNSIIIRTS
mgnify:CR=1 FL=1